MTFSVVLVDDVVEVRRLVRTKLRVRGGFEVVGEAGDGAEAIELTRSLQPDIVVLDLGLPDLAGHEVLSGVRRASPRTKVVIFSGNDLDQEWLRDVAGYVVKDADVEYLMDLLDTVGRAPDTAATLELPHSPASAKAAREFVARKVHEWRIDDILDDALLVASELAANAVTHAGSAARLRLCLTDTSFRIDVIDKGTGTPEPQPASWSEEHGRGLHLVDALTTAWGLEVVSEGKMVWAELPRPVTVGA